MDTQQEIKLTQRQQFWFDHIKSCEASGNSLASYAKENDLSVQTMYTTKASLVTKGILTRPSRPSFQRAQITPASPSQSDWRIQLPNGINVLFSDSSDTDYLSKILKVATRL